MCIFNVCLEKGYFCNELLHPLMKVWLLSCVLHELQTWYLYASLAALNQHLFYSVLPLQEFGALLFLVQLPVCDALPTALRLSLR